VFRSGLTWLAGSSGLWPSCDERESRRSYVLHYLSGWGIEGIPFCCQPAAQSCQAARRPVPVLRDPILADAAIDAIMAVVPGTAVYWAGPSDREPFAGRAAARGIRVCTEAYPDLDYADDGSLLVEREKRSVPPELVYDRVAEIICSKTLTTRTGKRLPMAVESYASLRPQSSTALRAAERMASELPQASTGSASIQGRGRRDHAR
jgi:LamB/YcsF family